MGRRNWKEGLKFEIIDLKQEITYSIENLPQNDNKFMDSDMHGREEEHPYIQKNPVLLQC